MTRHNPSINPEAGYLDIPKRYESVTYTKEWGQPTGFSNRVWDAKAGKFADEVIEDERKAKLFTKVDKELKDLQAGKGDRPANTFPLPVKSSESKLVSPTQAVVRTHIHSSGKKTTESRYYQIGKTGYTEREYQEKLNNGCAYCSIQSDLKDPVNWLSQDDHLCEDCNGNLEISQYCNAMMG
jgi:hypothetical protein